MIRANMLLTLAFLVIVARITEGKYLEVKIFRKTGLETVAVGSGQCTVVGNNNNSILGMGNCQNYIYYINLQVGTPSQTIGVQFDTGSNILWIPTIKGTGKGFNTATSSTYSTTTTSGSINYADGSSVSGFFGNDILKLAGTPINVNQSILWVDQEFKMNFPSEIQGLVGMGYTTTPNFLDLAYSNNLISSPVFALELVESTGKSMIYYNGIPQQIVNTTYYVPVIGNLYWQTSVIGVTVGDMDLTSVSANIAIIDSGTSIFYINSNLFNSVISNFFGGCNNNLTTPICPCGSNYPTFSFMFQGIEIYIDQSSYMSPLNTQQCTYQFGVIDTVPNILLGDTLFRNYVITFDKLNSQIGFSGDINFVQNIALKEGDTVGYTLLGIAGLLLIMSTASFCALGKFVANTPVKYAFKNRGLQLIDTSYSPSFNSPGLKVRLYPDN